jgi:hypothetical protein
MLHFPHMMGMPTQSLTGQKVEVCEAPAMLVMNGSYEW